MTEKVFSKILGCGLVVLTIAGLVPGRRPKHFLGLMNTDEQHSALRVPLAMALLYAASPQAPLRSTRKVLTVVGTAYLLVGTVGLANKRAGGALPSGITKFDVAYHYSVGLACLWLGKRSGRMMKP
jgi:hypothetical protein